MKGVAKVTELQVAKLERNSDVALAGIPGEGRVKCIANKMRLSSSLPPSLLWIV